MPKRSWLGQLQADLEHVVQYCPAVKVVLSAPCPVTALLEAVSHDRTWWKRQIRQATRMCQDDLDAWQSQQTIVVEAPTPAMPDVIQEQAAFVCPKCSARFPLRKHLGVHMARSHALVAPARMYAPGPVCITCLRFCHTLPRAQQHLRTSKACLLRACDLMPPMSLSDIREAEAADKARARMLRKGDWQLYAAAPPAIPACGPPQPTRAELRSLLQEDMPLSLLADPPQDPALVTWVRSEASFTTKEPTRTGTSSFWHDRVRKNSQC